MRLLRSAMAAAAAAALVATVATGPAAAQAAGAGTSLTETTVLAAKLGTLLDLSLLTDQATATTDKGTPGSSSRLTIGKIASSTVPAAPINQLLPTLEAKHSGPTSVDVAPGPISSLVSNPGALAPVLGGSVEPGKLTATLAGGVASAGIQQGLANLAAVGGLVSADSISSTLAGTADANNANGGRSVSVKNIELLDVGALLAGLGIDPVDLTVAQLSALLAELGLDGQVDLAGATTLEGAVAAINAAIDDLQAIVDSTPAIVGDVTGAIDGATSTLGGLLGVDLGAVTGAVDVAAAVAALNAAIDDLQAELEALLGQALLLVDAAPLVRLEGVEVGVTTKAVDTVAGSAATVIGKIGSVKVGGLTIPGADLAAGTAAVSALVTTLNTEVGQVLAAVHADLANLVRVSLLDRSTSVTQSGGYVTAIAGLTAASVTVTPPANLGAIVLGIANQAGAGDLLSALPALPGADAMDALQTALSLTGGVTALAAPASLTVASVRSASEFIRPGVTTPAPPTPATPTGGELPRTGGDDLPWIAGGLLAAVASLTIRRLLAVA